VEGRTAIARGELDIGATGVLVAACRDGVDRIDLRGVTFLDSSGVRELMRAHRSVRTRGLDLVLVSPSAPVRRVLALLGLTEHLPVVDG
jgi:anti-anti-sigma factor